MRAGSAADLVALQSRRRQSHPAAVLPVAMSGADGAEPAADYESNSTDEEVRSPNSAHSSGTGTTADVELLDSVIHPSHSDESSEVESSFHEADRAAGLGPPGIPAVLGQLPTASPTPVVHAHYHNHTSTVNHYHHHPPPPAVQLFRDRHVYRNKYRQRQVVRNIYVQRSTGTECADKGTKRKAGIVHGAGTLVPLGFKHHLRSSEGIVVDISESDSCAHESGEEEYPEQDEVLEVSGDE